MLENIQRVEKVKDSRQVKFYEFEQQKDVLRKITNKEEKTQEEFDRYLKFLFDEEDCKYMTGIKDFMHLCNQCLHNCRYQGQNRFTFRKSLKPECKRREIIKLKRLL